VYCFPEALRARIGIHTCPGGDRDATHSCAVDYASLLPTLFQLRAGRFFLQLTSERQPSRVLSLIRKHLVPGRIFFVGVTDPIDPRTETPEEVRDLVLKAAEYIPVEQLGTTDDCGFAPFADDRSTSRETALAKIRTRVEETAMAVRQLFGRGSRLG
jgi:5-methyltetrahydropteroyltriglutamate--homocysteine methyltransferase